MKNKKSIFVLLLVLMMCTAAISASAAGVYGKIDVVFNSITLKVNGETVATDNFVYNETTYVPLRAVSEMLGKDVVWDGTTKTAHINDADYVAPVGQQWVLKTSKFVSAVENTHDYYVKSVSAPAEGNIFVKYTNSAANDNPLNFEASFAWSQAPAALKPETSYSFDISGELVNYYDTNSAYAHPYAGMNLYWSDGLQGSTSRFPEKPSYSWYLTADGNSYNSIGSDIRVTSDPNPSVPNARSVYMTTPKHTSGYTTYDTIYLVADVSAYGYWLYEYEWVN